MKSIIPVGRKTINVLALCLPLALGACAFQPSARDRALDQVSAEVPDPIEYVAPEFRENLIEYSEPARASECQVLTAENLPEMRMRAKAYQQSPELLPSPQVREEMIPGRAGAPSVRVYIIGAKAGDSRPAILYIHGGGYIFGEAKSDLHELQELALRHDCVIVTVDYRLAPETAFPGSLEDNYAGLKWLFDKAADLGVDRSRIALMGESAGGGHAAMLTVAARDRGEVPIKQQILVYPMLDDRTGSAITMPYWMGYLSWTPAMNRLGWTSLLGVPAGSSKVPTGAVPAREKDLRGLPPTFIAVGSVDLFVNENIEYAQRLINEGVPTELMVFPGGFHGFQKTSPNSTLARRFNAAIDAAINRAFVSH